MRTLFLVWFDRCFVPEVSVLLSVRGYLLKFFWILGNSPGHPEPHEFNSEGIEVVYLPLNTSLIQLPGQGVIGTLRLFTYRTLWKGLLGKRTHIGHHECLEGLHRWRRHYYYRKSHERRQGRNNKFLARGQNCVQCWRMTSLDLVQSQSRKSWKRLWMWQKRWWVKGFKMWILEKS